MAKKSIFITGAAGFVGTSCVKMFLEKGWNVTALIHKNAPKDLKPSASLCFVYSSLNDKEKIHQIFQNENFDVVLNCAGRATDVGRKEDFELCSPSHIIDCINKFNVSRFIHMSSTDVYGVKNFLDANEKTPLDNNKKNHYPGHKIEAEKLIQKKNSKKSICLSSGLLLFGDQKKHLFFQE